MNLFGFDISRRREVRSESPESETVQVSAANFLTFFGQDTADLPHVTIERALKVPAVAAAVAFLSRTLAAVPLHGFRATENGPVKLTGKLQTVIHENPNPLMDTFKFRQYFWQQVFTGGRGLGWIERNGQNLEAIWPMNPKKTSISRVGQRLVYRHDGKEYPAEDVIDVPFMLKEDMLNHYGPIMLASKAIQLALSMNDYASGFFAGGGVPPLALTGPLPVGNDGMTRAIGDVHRAIQVAKESKKPIFPLPPGHKLEAVGIDPEKSQMTDARRFQIEEIARSYQLPPVFLQDLTHATLNNSEQQDLHLVKHNIGQWAAALEGEMNLKIFGRLNGSRYVQHNLDGLMRGDYKSRIEGNARAIQTSQMTPNEAREKENRPKHANKAADELLIQGATVVLGTAAVKPPAAEPKSDDDTLDDGASK